MRFIPLKPQRLYCQNCEETYSLPQNGTIKLYMEIRCPLDNFELVLFSLGNTLAAQGKSYPLCPCCYNNPPAFEDMMGGDKEKAQQETHGSDNTSSNAVVVRSSMGCNQCRHATCKQSVVFNGLCPCPGSIATSASVGGKGGGGGGRGDRGMDAPKDCPGTLVLDMNSKPNWKLACNQCNTLLRFHANIHNITPLPIGVGRVRGECEDCGTRLVKVDFNKAQKSPMSNGEYSCVGCIVCNDTLNNLTEIVMGRSMNLLLLRQLRHKRGGKGGKGGRGRGRGRGKNVDVKMSFSEF